jgi:pimeloyl-ACP methyl ester carboxylesterase
MITWPAFAPTLSQADVHELTDASHFLQEDAPERILHVLLAFLERPRCSSHERC